MEVHELIALLQPLPQRAVVRIGIPVSELVSELTGYETHTSFRDIEKVTSFESWVSLQAEGDALFDEGPVDYDQESEDDNT